MENLIETSAVAHVRTPGGIVRMDRATVDQHNADNAENPGDKYEVLDDNSPEVKALYSQPGQPQPVPGGGAPVAQGAIIPAVDPSGQPTNTGGFTPAMTPEIQWADPADAKYVMQLGGANGRWFVTNDKGHRFRKGQSAAGYATEADAQAQAQKMMQAAPGSEDAPV